MLTHKITSPCNANTLVRYNIPTWVCYARKSAYCQAFLPKLFSPLKNIPLSIRVNKRSGQHLL